MNCREERKNRFRLFEKWWQTAVGRFAQRVFMAFLLIGFCHSAGVAAGTLHLRTYDVNDPQMGIPAFRVLAPQSWQLRGGLTWSAALANLVTADVAITAPDNSAGFYIHPSPMYISGQIESQWPVGQLYLGMIVMPIPNSPTAFLQQLVLPQRRPNARNLRLVEQEDLSHWAAGVAATQPGGIQGYGTRSRFAYTENGRNWEEDFYCVVLVSGGQNLLWLADRNLSVRAEAGKLDALKPLAGAFVNSFRVEQSWYARFTKAQQQWIAAKQQGIADAGALSRAISRSNDQFNQSLMQSWNARQQAEDRASREFSEYIRDSENYYDPVNEMQVELPGSYQKAWTNNQGEYLLSDVPGYNPNLNSNLNWEEIRPIR